MTRKPPQQPGLFDSPPPAPAVDWIRQRQEETGIDLLGDTPLPIDPKLQAEVDEWRARHRPPTYRRNDIS